MAEYITLLGAEDVRSAASTIRQAAETMRQAAGSMEESLHNNRLFLDDWLLRFKEILCEKGGNDG